MRVHRTSTYVMAAAAAFALMTAGATGPPAAPTADPTWRSFETVVMATRFEVRLPDREGASEAAEAVFAIFGDVDRRMSEWKESSPLSAVNRQAGLEPVEVPDDLRSVIVRGLEIGEATDGAFDITWAALWGLWDFRTDRPAVPDPDEVARRSALVDYRQVEVDEEAGTVRLGQPEMKIGLGGIAKGWALERAAAKLRELGFADFLLSGGGQVQAGGSNGGRPWRVGIRDPRGAADDFFASLEVGSLSVSTSGDYERFFIVDGIRYHHILDPRTGQPARGVRSATAVSADATLADAVSTAMVVMGAEQGMALVEATRGLEGVIIDDAGRVTVSSGLEGRLVVVHPPRH